MRTVSSIIVHHTATPQTWTLEKIRAFHKTKWSEIGYHYVIERDPLLLRVGRRSDRAGAHCKGANRNSLGIVIVGNFEEETLDRQTLGFAAQAVADLCVSYGLTSSDVYGHNHAPGGTTATVCPGFSMDDLRARVSEILSKGGAS